MHPIHRFILVSVFSMCAQTAPLAAASILVVDFSPDTTAAPIASTSLTNVINPLQGQIIGESFTLTADTILSGGSLFVPSAFGPLGTQVRFMIWSNPNAAPIIDILTVIDQADSLYATSVANTGRRHASITPTPLTAGTYWFSMPAVQNTNFSVNTGTYGNNLIRLGGPSATLPTAVSGMGDMYFQLDAVPEPSTVAMLSVAFFAFGCRRRAAALR